MLFVGTDCKRLDRDVGSMSIHSTNAWRDLPGKRNRGSNAGNCEVGFYCRRVDHDHAAAVQLHGRKLVITISQTES